MENDKKKQKTSNKSNKSLGKRKKPQFSIICHYPLPPPSPLWLPHSLPWEAAGVSENCWQIAFFFFKTFTAIFKAF